MSPWLNHSLSGYFVFFMIKLQGHNEIAHAFQIYFVSLYRNLEFHFLSLFANQDPQVKTHTHTHPVLFQRYNATSMCVCSVARSCLTLWESVDCSLPVSSVHGILQTRILEWVAISTSKGSSHPGIDQESPASPILAGAFLITEPPGSPIMQHTYLSLLIFSSWLQILQTEILKFSFLSWIFSCDFDSEPLARLAQSQVSWAAFTHLRTFFSTCATSVITDLLLFSPALPEGLRNLVFFLFLSSLWIAVRFFIVYLFYLGGCGWGTEDVFSILSTVI